MFDVKDRTVEASRAGSLPDMEFTGRAYFSFAEPNVYRLYRLLADAAAEGAQVGVEWIGIAPEGIREGPLAGDDLATAIAEDLRRREPTHHAAYVQTLLAAVHGERIDLEHPGLIELALDRAGCDSAALLAPGHAPTLRATLEDATSIAKDLGVQDVPSLYHHGPVLLVRTTAALATGSATSRLRLIASVMEDDGLWELRKP